MEITIRELNQLNFQDADRCDGAFTVDARLVLFAEDGIIRYTVVSTPLYQKRYLLDEVDYADYIGNPHKTVYFAYVDHEVAGQIRLCRYWNRYAYIKDIVVDSHFRRRGVGRELVQAAKQWACDKQLAGVMLETQNNNIGACRLYERCGFELAGFDRRLYQGLNPDTDEIALYWYWMRKSG
jgi:ribosomal protein S18 acetylase RimI-like enzyme